MADLTQFERMARSQGYRYVCGIDEAGRGPLAGPVFAAAVIFDGDSGIKDLNDSKKLTEKKREELFPLICEKALAYGIASACEAEIDELNILNATFLAMKRAVDMLRTVPDILLVDGNRDPGIGITTRLLVKGDSRSESIAAASILAKVSRDRFMTELDAKYPQYNLKKHKGYPTKEHYEAIRLYGISEIHRKSFLKNLEEKHG